MKKTAFSIILLFTLHVVYANNLQISEVNYSGERALSFRVSWQHSWNTNEAPGNHDAVWIFAKYRMSGEWKHLHLSTSGENYQVTSEQALRIKPIATGLILERSAPGSGPVSARISMELPADYSPDELSLRIMGIEMIFIPEEAFYLGDGTSINSFRRGDTAKALHVTNNSAIPVDTIASALSPDIPEGPEETIPAAYPNGYEGFYVMKYEITQKQYVDFLNMLTYTQQEQRTVQSPAADAGTYAMHEGGGARTGIVIKKPGAYPDKPAVYACNLHADNNYNSTDDGADIAANWLNWGDVTAYLDWAGLSPMTELEFEKICRGPQAPVPGAMAWGTPWARDANTLIHAGFPYETVEEQADDTTGIANHGYTGVQGPLRAGFAANDSSGRLQTGAAYYGAMEMSGNLWEVCVTVNEAGLVFTGTAGDGALTSDGCANQDNWPNAITGKGACYRGGAFMSGVFEVGSFRDLAVSDRYYAGLKPDLRRKTCGGRGVLRIK